MYFKAQKSTKIRIGKSRPPSKEPITIEVSPTARKEESPSKTPITYERGSPRSSTWRERIKLQDSKTVLQEVQTALQETLTKLQEAEKHEKNTYFIKFGSFLLQGLKQHSFFCKSPY